MSEHPYLRVKNWGRHQHYDPTKRRPPWIKVYNELLGGDDAFQRLDEFEQWQLIRVWLVASRSSQLTRDENEKLVPVVPNDAKALQRAVMSLKRLPLEAWIRDGWLIPVSEADLVDAPPKPSRASRRASTVASTFSVKAEAERTSEKNLLADQAVPRDAAPASLPVENDFLVQRLMRAIGAHADTGTLHVIRATAAGLPEASLAKVAESVECSPGIRDRAKYAVRALQSERDELAAARAA